MKKGDEIGVSELSKVLHSRHGNDIQNMIAEGNHFCKNKDTKDVCVLWEKRSSGVCLADLICDINDISCTNVGDCKKAGHCVNACRRFQSYRIAAGVLGYRERQPLPICVRVFISDHYGSSRVGFKN